MKRMIMLSILLFALPLFAVGSDSPYSCEAPPQIQEQIRQANPNTIESLLVQYPDNFWIQRSYIEFHTDYPYQLSGSLGIPGSKVDASVIERFKANYDSHPDDPQAAYLFAYALIHTDSPKSVEILTNLTNKAPSFPAAYMTLAILHGYASFRDQNLQKSYVESFLECCPNTVEPRIASLAVQLDGSDTLAAYTRSLRERIAGKENDTLLPLHNYLWQLELKHALPGEKKEVEDRIRKDLVFLEGLDQNKFRQAPSLVVQGYNQIGDTAALDRLMSSNASMFSSAGLSVFLKARSEWSRENPMPPPAAGAEEHAEYYKKQLQFLDTWVERIPENMLVLDPRFQALASLPSTSNEILIFEGTRILALARRLQGASYASTALRVLKVWAERDILLDQIPSIARELISPQFQTPGSLTNTTQSDLTGGDETSALLAEFQRWTTETEARAVLAIVHAKKGEFEEAKNILTEWTKALEERRIKADAIRAKQIQQIQDARASNSPQATPTPFNTILASVFRVLPRDEAKYYEACAELAVAEGRTLDALTFYQSSLRMIFSNPISSADYADIENMKIAGNTAWKKLGRSQEEWDEWIKSVQRRTPPQLQSMPRPVMEARQIPEFSLPDQHGVTWTLAGLKGKTTLINVWATWCGPCRRELPHLQKLYEQTKDRNDIQVITLNIDEDRSPVEPFMKENKYSFPSLFAYSFVKEFAGSIPVPTTWIADATGTIRSETIGFNDQGDRWIDETLKQITGVSENTK